MPDENHVPQILRLEDGEWVQTLKARAAGTAFGRFEHNVRRSATPDGTPAPDASLHAGSDVGERLIDIVRTVDEPVGVRYRTQIERMTATLSIRVARRGKTSPIWIPGTLVAIGLNSPRISSGAVGFMSQVS